MIVIISNGIYSQLVRYLSNGQIEVNKTQQARKKETCSNRNDDNAFLEYLRKTEIQTLCPNCGHHNPSSVMHCYACGAVLLTNL